MDQMVHHEHADAGQPRHREQHLAAALERPRGLEVRVIGGGDAAARSGRVLVEGLTGVELTNAFTVTNWTGDYALDCDADADAAIADTLGTLINALIEAGVITGSVAA